MSALPLIPLRAGEFEGPLDLLLELVRRNQVALESMPLAEITRQYLDYMRAAQRSQVDLGADFIYMAATLIQIKSRLLLPQDPALSGSGSGAADDTPEALLDRLREHARAKAAAEMLKTKLEVEETVWSRPGGEARFSGPEETLVSDKLTAAPRQATLADLIETLGETMRRVKSQAAIAVETDPVTVHDRMIWLRDQFNSNHRSFEITDLFGRQSTQAARCCLFLGILELGRDGYVRIEQHEPFGEVTVGRRG